MSIFNVLKQFRHNNQSVAIILDKSGASIGTLTLEMIVEKNLSGEMLVVDFNKAFKANLPLDRGKTLSDLIKSELDHPPSSGESVQIDNFEFTVIELTILGTKTVLVRSLS